MTPVELPDPSMKPPNPGSLKAQEQGCTCPVMDNNDGHRAPWPPDGWWITGGCPLHDPVRGKETACQSKD